MLRCFFDALGLTRVTMAVTLLSFPINVLLNYVMIFGKWGLPTMGGIAPDTLPRSRTGSCLQSAVGIAVRKHPFAEYKVFHGPYKLSFAAWLEQLRIGVPGPFHRLGGRNLRHGGPVDEPLGTLVIAAHQSAISFGTLIYMFPLSVSQALTIVVGFEVGAERIKHAIQYRRLGMTLSLSVAGLLIASPLAPLRAGRKALQRLTLSSCPLLQSFLVLRDLLPVL